MKFEELQTKIAGAKDMKEAKEIIANYNKTVADEKKKEALAIQKENEALAGTREKLAVAIHVMIVSGGWISKLADVKAQGFTYKLDTEEVKYKSVALTVVGAKRASGGGGGGNGGKTKDEIGISLGELVETYATDAEKQAIAKAPSISRSWQLKVQAKKRILADNPSLVKK